MYLKLFSPNREYYFQWQQLDFTRKDYHDSYVVNKYPVQYGFNLEHVLLKLAIKELEDPISLKDLVSKRHKGSRVPATLIIERVEQTAYLETNPADRSIILFDKFGNKI